MTKTEIAEILKTHSEWVADNTKGKRANLRGANLGNADLRYANLGNADLRYANLRNADLDNADLRGAYMVGAYMVGANLGNADLRYANMVGANLYGAYMVGANLYGAYMVGANLRYANLRNADLTDANLPDYQLCPQDKTFEAYKKVRGGVVLKLRIEGPRTSSLVGRKCRTQKAFVVEAFGSKAENANEFKSLHDPKFVYKVGEYVEVQNYDPDIRIECTSGIHFFMTREEAENYC